MPADARTPTPPAETSGPVELPDGSVIVPAALAGSVRRILVRDLAQHIRLDGGAPSAGARQLLYALARAEARHEADQPGSAIGTNITTPPTMEVSTAQAAQAIGCSASYVRRLVRRGALMARRVGRSRNWLIDTESLDTYRYRR